jgi:1-acyl-sn-glycerol-3-phosphate acyltransferase
VRTAALVTDPRAVAPRRPFFTASVYATATLLVALHASICLLALPLTLPFDRDRRFAARLASRLARAGLLAAPCWRPAVSRLASIRLESATVVVMNHRSLADIALAVAVPGGPRIVAKSWVSRVPLLGLSMRLCGHESFDTDSPRSVRRMMARLEGLLARGESVLLFPDATRREAPGLGPFRDGAFHLAVKSRADVLPVVLHGMGELVPKGSFAFHDVPVDVRPLPRVSPGDDRRALSRRVRLAMAAALADRA